MAKRHRILSILTGKIEINDGEYYTFHTLFQGVTGLSQFLTGQQ